MYGVSVEEKTKTNNVNKRPKAERLGIKEQPQKYAVIVELICMYA